MSQLDARTQTLLRRLVRHRADGAVRKLVDRYPAPDLAAAMEHLTETEQRRVYRLIVDRDAAAEIMASLSGAACRAVTHKMNQDTVIDLLSRMSSDDATDVVASMNESMRERVLEALGDDATVDLLALLAWPSESAGGLMSTQAFVLPQTSTCGQAIAALQERHEELESVYYLYLVDEGERLVGVTSLRNLLTHPPRMALSEMMVPEPIRVAPTVDQEEVARIVARYDLLAVPVVDDKLRVLGIVTVDDVLDVIHNEAAEDMMLMAGVADPSLSLSLRRQAAYRGGWLLATIAGGLLAAEIITQFEDSLKSMAVLAVFIPVIMGMGGNVGIQSATLAVRGLATGSVRLGGVLPFLWREARVGLMLGVLFGVLLGAYGLMRYPDQPMLGVSLATSILLAIVAAGIIGAALPVVFQRLHVDPAIATGPFVTTLVDLLGIVIYFTVAGALLGL